MLRQTTPVNINQLETNLNQSPEGRQYDIQIVNRMPISELTEWAQQAQQASNASMSEIRSLMDSYQIPSDKQNTVISTIVPRNTVEGTVTTVRNGSAIIAANGTTYTVPAGTLKSGDMVNVNVATERDIAPTVTTIQPKTSDIEIKQIYNELLGREPDEETLNSYRYFDEQIIRNNIMDSSEYKNKIAEDQAAAEQAAAERAAAERAAKETEIKQIYNELLGRDPDQSGLDFYRNFDAQQIRASIINSSEYKAKNTPTTETTDTKGVTEDGATTTDATKTENIYLNQGQTLNITNSNSRVFGSAGADRVIINPGVTGVTFDQNVDHVDLPGSSDSFSNKLS